MSHLFVDNSGKHISNNCSSNNSVSLSSDDVEHGQHEYDFMGDILNNRYAVFYKLGSGAYSTVWLAYDIDDNSFCAFKIQYSHDYDEGLGEVNVLRKMTQVPHINQLLDAFITVRLDSQYICMKTEICAGTLYDAIKSASAPPVEVSSGPASIGESVLTLDMIQKITKQVLEGMEAIHSLGIIHADIKPENILLTGHSKNVKEVIAIFTKCDFHRIYQDLRQTYILDKQLNPSNGNHKKKLRKEKGNLYRATLQIIMTAINIDSDCTSQDSTLSLHSTNSSDDGSDDGSEDGSEDGSDDGSSDNEKHYNVIEREYLERCVIKLTDFGTVVVVKDNQYEEIQTRHYRAPEVVLGLKYTPTCDVWSIGCTLYELYTGKMLFNPLKTDALTRDQHHVNDIYNMVGKFDKQMIKKSPRKTEFSKLSLTKVNETPLIDRLAPVAPHDNLLLFVDFLKQSLVVNGNKRPTVAELKKHAFVMQ